ncbi:conserved protein of unknown function [Tenacibaculum sp. 190524A02b]
MKKETVNYLINHYLYLIPLAIKSKLKYPYLQEQELEIEKEKIAKVILNNYSDKIFLNNCLKCGKLARTPKAKQCQFCFYSWY